MNDPRKYAAVENYLDVADPNRLWMPICGYSQTARCGKCYKQDKGNIW